MTPQLKPTVFQGLHAMAGETCGSLVKVLSLEKLPRLRRGARLSLPPACWWELEGRRPLPMCGRREKRRMAETCLMCLLWLFTMRVAIFRHRLGSFAQVPNDVGVQVSLGCQDCRELEKENAWLHKQLKKVFGRELRSWQHSADLERQAAGSTWIPYARQAENLHPRLSKTQATNASSCREYEV